MSVRLMILSSATAAVLVFGGSSVFASGEEGAKAAGAQSPAQEQEAAAAPEGAKPEKDVETVANEQDKPYEVVCETVNGQRECKVDQQTFIGWRTYHGFCAQCHAQDAVGSTFAPSLITRMERVDRERFDQVVAQGFTGQMGVMPGFADNPNVMPRLDEMYAYLKARSDGVLPSGRPARLPRE